MALKSSLLSVFRRLYNIYIYILYNHFGEVTLISNNCIAGFIYHGIGHKFYSPTINLQIAPKDYVKFVNDLEMYLSADLVEVKKPNVEEFKKLGGGEISFPVGKIEDITIYFQHYSNFDVAKKKWEQRKQRIIKDKIVLLLVDTFCNEENIEMFSQAPYKKIFLSNDSTKAGWLKSGIFLKYDSQICTEWHQISRMFGKWPDLLRRTYFEKTNIYQSIFK